METIKLSKKNFWFRYWYFISLWPKTYPKDTCSLKRSLIIKTFLLFFIFPALCVAKITRAVFKLKDNFMTGIDALIMASLFQMLGFIILLAITQNFIISYFLGPVFLSLALLLVLSLLWLFCRALIIVSNKLLSKSKKPSNPSIITVIYRGWKDKLCSKIEYIE